MVIGSVFVCASRNRRGYIRVSRMKAWPSFLMDCCFVHKVTHTHMRTLRQTRVLWRLTCRVALLLKFPHITPPSLIVTHHFTSRWVAKQKLSSHRPSTPLPPETWTPSSETAALECVRTAARPSRPTTCARLNSKPKTWTRIEILHFSAY